MKTVRDVSFNGKKVLIRCDLNVPFQGEVVTDDTRIVESIPTIKHVIEDGGKAIIFSHLGRPKSEEDRAKYSLRIVVPRLSELLGKEVIFVSHTRGKELEEAINKMQPGDVLLVENTRFEDLDGKKESGNDPELARYWAGLGDIFVNDAFGTAHRSHASNVGIGEHLETVSGYLIEKEINFYNKYISNPKRPYVAILGGAKVGDKIGVIESLVKVADKILVGGGIAYTFLKAKGYNIGKSLLEEDKLEFAKEMLEKGHDKIVLPVDVAVAKEFSPDADYRYTWISEILDDEEALDIGPKTIELFKEILKDAKTVVWNGPVGVFEFPNFAKGTNAICEILANLEDAITVIGGGDSAAAAIQAGYKEKFDHISTGGGASLMILEGKPLPGVEIIKK